MTNEELYKLIVSELTELNEDLDYESYNEISTDTVLFGDVDALDSLSLISFLVSLEKKIKQESGETVNLATPDALAGDNPPVATVGSLIEFVFQKIA